MKVYLGHRLAKSSKDSECVTSCRNEVIGGLTRVTKTGHGDIPVSSVLLGRLCI